MSALETPVVLKLTPELAGILLSPEEFDAIEDCDELYNYELVHGVLVVAPPPDIGERAPKRCSLVICCNLTKIIIPRGAPSTSLCPSTPCARPIADAAPTV